MILAGTVPAIRRARSHPLCILRAEHCGTDIKIPLFVHGTGMSVSTDCVVAAWLVPTTTENYEVTEVQNCRDGIAPDFLLPVVVTKDALTEQGDIVLKREACNDEILPKKAARTS